VSETIDPTGLLNSLPDPVVVVGTDGTILWGNDMAETVFGWSRETSIGIDATELVHPDDLNTALVSLVSVQDKPAGTPIEIRVRERGGAYRRAEVRGRSAVGVPGIDGVVLVLRDVTDRRRWEVAAGDDTAASAVLEALPTIALVLTEDGRISSVNRAFTRLLGHDIEGTIGRPLTDFVSVAKVLAVSDQLARLIDGRGRLSFETDLVDVDGDTHAMSLTVVDLRSDRAVQGLVATATDIAKLAEARDRLAHAATHDELTGLPNRLLLHDHLGLALSNAAMRDVGVGVVGVDIDDFTVVNDSFGRAAGDQVLAEVANRLGSAVRDPDMVSRYGGDQFMLVASGVDQLSLGRLVDRIHWLMRSPIAVTSDCSAEGTEVRVTLSVGAVLAEPGTATTDVIERADSAMRRDRSRRRQRQA
jgi:diguanylate cyclase (GGDEF)-like protein/PAS domain S-box-containing protein